MPTWRREPAHATRQRLRDFVSSETRSTSQLYDDADQGRRVSKKVQCSPYCFYCTQYGDSQFTLRRSCFCLIHPLCVLGTVECCCSPHMLQLRAGVVCIHVLHDHNLRALSFTHCVPFLRLRTSVYSCITSSLKLFSASNDERESAVRSESDSRSGSVRTPLAARLDYTLLR